MSGPSPPQPRPGSRRLLAWFFCLALFPQACAAGGSRSTFDLWPFLYIESDEEAGERRIEALGPVFEYRDDPEASAVYLRPLYNRVLDKDVPRAERETLWPFGFGTQTQTLDRSWFFPLYQRTTDVKADGTAERRERYLLPFYAHRTPTPEKERDLLLWPFWGRLHDWYGRDQVNIVAWPLYVHQQREEARSWDVPWPFVTIVRWEDEGRGWRVWPLYGRNHRPDRLDKRFVLWPFYTRVWARTEDGLETDQWMLWPFYGRIRAPAGRARTWLWPFFEHRVDRAEQIDQWHYPWPFLGRTEGLEGAPIAGRRYWPLYVWEDRGATRSRQYLWPFIWYEAHTPVDPNDEASVYFRFVPFVFHAREEHRGEETGVTQLWPLYRWERKPGGAEESEFLSLWPGRSGTGWTRNWAPFFRLYHRESVGEERDERRVLGRLVRSKRTPTERFFEVKPFWRGRKTFSPEPEDDTVMASEWNVLSGLIGRSREDGRDRLRLLWLLNIPLGPQG